MFRALLCPSSGARDYNVDYHIGLIVLGLQALACKPDTFLFFSYHSDARSNKHHIQRTLNTRKKLHYSRTVL